jgi:hypothetical protein
MIGNHHIPLVYLKRIQPGHIPPNGIGNLDIPVVDADPETGDAVEHPVTYFSPECQWNQELGKRQ